MWKWLKELDELLRGAKTDPKLLAEGTRHLKLAPLVLVPLILGVVYGVCMGLYAAMNEIPQGGWQMLSSAIKVPALFYLTLLVTFPSLYVFGALLGVRVTAMDTFRLIVAATAVNLAILASFAPITAFFTLSTSSYAFMKLLNVAFFAIAGVLGLLFLWKLLRTLDVAQGGAPSEATDDGTPPCGFTALGGERVRRLFKVWLLLYAVVGAQMSWVLRPFIGAPGLPFEIFRARQANFFIDVMQTLETFLGL